jgi:hypothetical protein
MVGSGRIVRRFEDCAQFARLVIEDVELGPDSDVAFEEDSQPVFGLVRFLDRNAQFGNELGARSGAAAGVNN